MTSLDVELRTHGKSALEATGNSPSTGRPISNPLPRGCSKHFITFQALCGHGFISNPSLRPGVYDGMGLGLETSDQSTWPEHRQELVTPQKYWMWLLEEGMLNGRQMQQIVRIEGETGHEELFIKWEALYQLPNLLEIFILGLVHQAADTSDLKAHKML